MLDVDSIDFSLQLEAVFHNRGNRVNSFDITLEF